MLVIKQNPGGEMEEHKFFGEILKEEGKLTDEIIEDALNLQKDNPDRKLGEILVTLNYIKYEDIKETLLKQYRSTGAPPKDVDKWLKQDEVDKIISSITKA